eukprot:TRINITY_DN50710_c0_g1_i1.p1 TRINITY_DN50710_c0_g1~~TRINITY_DN50710_c0_g1_i1.p1  ORF type:complete len:329 (-),score=73.01 TRINITY_DN50710_c0_g1_i1:167-1132(-)
MAPPSAIDLLKQPTDAPVEAFQPAETFQGARPGMAFKLGLLGLGYYLDPLQAQKTLLDEVIPQLPETWRTATFREEQLCVDEAKGCGLDLEHSEFGFAVTEVEAEPGQELQAGEVIVAIEGRILAGLSAPQMQASFVKRQVKGARLHVANLAHVEELSKRDPAIVEMWDNVKQHAYFFHKKTGKSAWTWQELQSESTTASSSSQAGSQGTAQAAPIDLSHFLTHGFAKQKEAPKKKAKNKEAAKDAGKDESDFARDERKRWREWNEGGSGGYTEAFFARYKKVQAFPEKPKNNDKRLKGSVGPGNGMEYMARWTGSKNSFN